jgi:hypothetical protein
MQDFSMDQLTLGEIAQIEEITGQSISVMSDESAPKGKFLAAIAWLAKRREDPAFTLAQAEAMSMEEFSAVLSVVNPKGSKS